MTGPGQSVVNKNDVHHSESSFLEFLSFALGTGSVSDTAILPA
jgi:hypothetical protein